MQENKAQYRLRELLEAFPQEEHISKKRELAQLLHVSRTQLGRLLSGHCDPSGTQLKIMAEFFGCSVDALYQPSEVLGA